MELRYIIQNIEYTYILPDIVCNFAYVVNVMPNEPNMQYYKNKS